MTRAQKERTPRANKTDRAAGRAHPLADLVRYLAQQAAERDYEALQPPSETSQGKKGKR